MMILLISLLFLKASFIMEMVTRTQSREHSVMSPAHHPAPTVSSICLTLGHFLLPQPPHLPTHTLPTPCSKLGYFKANPRYHNISAINICIFKRHLQEIRSLSLNVTTIITPKKINSDSQISSNTHSQRSHFPKLLSLFSWIGRLNIFGFYLIFKNYLINVFLTSGLFESDSNEVQHCTCLICLLYCFIYNSSSLPLVFFCFLF